VNQFLSLADAAHGRIIVGLGTGDQLSREENRTWGVPFPSADDRRHEMVSIAEELRQFETWIGGGSEATAALTRTLGATLNLWDVDATRIRTEAARGPVSWAGPTPEQVGPWLSSLEEAGATWAVVTWATEISTLREWREGS
jgi:alkanesulfonate monooxygenase SsuD/methylene tetrahydromethanopterin reductase-like flavin-dependent oxidoreductase (luciferase family)